MERQKRHRMMYVAHIFLRVAIMRTTINLDETLFDQARRLTGLRGRTAVIREGLKAF
jgi:Arc/MetJ family transcription regulator